MIIVNLIGGLGNQMFQYATGRALALRTDVPLLLDTSSFRNYDLRCYELGELSIKARLVTGAELKNFGVRNGSNGLLKRLAKAFRLDQTVVHYDETSFAYDRRIQQINPPVYLNGYWQSERYFSDIADILRRDFTLKRPFDAANSELAGQINNLGGRAVSLHIRRGDYVSNPNTAQYHGVCSLDYYRNAVSYIAERISDPHFFVFSDDHAWVEENFKLEFSVTQVDVNGSDRGVYDMALMKACRHHIIANSSFSWWGAWLNPHPDKIIVAPQCWFSGASHDTSDLIPRSWIRL